MSTRVLLAAPGLSQYRRSAFDTLAWTICADGDLLQAGWTVYLDGSFIDGPSALLGRVGFGFVALGMDGLVKAAAYGVPPPWIRCIHGAEMWAFFAALRCSMPGVSFRSDRRAVVDTFRRGAEYATAAPIEHARLWGLIFAACDDYEAPHKDLPIEWMPAHTTEAHVGVVRLSDGHDLTAQDRFGNDLADSLAKKGAHLHRVPEAARLQVHGYRQLAVWAARTLALRTYAANHLEVPDVMVFAEMPRGCRGGDARLLLHRCHAAAMADPQRASMPACVSAAAHAALRRYHSPGLEVRQGPGGDGRVLCKGQQQRTCGYRMQ